MMKICNFMIALSTFINFGAASNGNCCQMYAKCLYGATLIVIIQQFCS